ncbi:MAG TPA: twin-arginine translocation signal domain-containing protein, partial [Pirellula sp.]|nr:twin-arginine translocation signal domain-containing protein [Pirellula sp.]
MLTFTGQGISQTCNGVTRRDFLQAGTLGAIGLGLPQYLKAAAAGKVDPTKSKRSAIMIFNLGAPSQIDTFDMKPDAPLEIRGP